ncbi:MAG: protein kinase [Planctomycetes bacterium]|nr:protein kinase [Planctomycetota bacterium]
MRDERCPACGGPLRIPAPAEETQPSSSLDATRIADADRPEPTCSSPTLRLQERPGSDLDATPRLIASPAPGAPGRTPTTAPSSALDAEAGRPFGRYRLLERLGAGGMGIVWKAWDTDLRRVIALKQIREPDAGGRDAVERFLREARVAARLRHPNIVPVHDVGIVDGTHFLTMDLVAGRTLQSWLDEGRDSRRAGAREALGRLRQEVALLAEVADAIAHAHEQGIVHRDLKPGNVLLDGAGRPFVTDFGLAKEVGLPAATPATAEIHRSLTLTGQALGTPAYMSPEQALGDAARIGPGSDVWALGAILYEILTGETPFERAGSAWDMLRAVVHDEPVRPRARHRFAPAELEGACLHALEKDPAARYRTAAEMAEELRRWLRGEPLLARPPGPARRAWRWAVRRARILVPVSVAGLVLTGALASAVHDRRFRAEAEARAETRAREWLARIAEAVDVFEDDVGRYAMSPGARRAHARQPLALLEQLIRDEPDFGPAFAWRGRVHDRLGEATEAEADFDQGCRLAPDRAIVWFLKGSHDIEAYGRSRGTPPWVNLSTGMVFGEMPPDTPEEARLRESGLAAFARMEGLLPRDAGLAPWRATLGRAVAALHAGGKENLRKAAELARGLPSAAARRTEGRALFLLGRFEDACRAFSAGLAEWTVDEESLEGRGNARAAVALERLAAGTDARPAYADAIADFEEALRLRPTSARLHATRAHARFGLGEARAAQREDPREDFRNAIADCGEAMRLAPESSMAVAGRGNTWLALAEAEEERGLDPLDSYRKALADEDAAIQADPAFTLGYYNRGVVLYHIARVQAARGLDPHGTYALAIEAYGKTGPREAWFPHALESRGNAWLGIAEFEAAAGRDPLPSLEQALAEMDAAVLAEPGLASTRYNRATALFRRGRAETARELDPRASFAKALEDYGEFLRRRPADRKGWNERGNLWLELGAWEGGHALDPRPSYERAVADYGEDLRLTPGRAEVLGNRGRAYFCLGEARAGRGESAAEAFARAKEDLEAAVAGAFEKARLSLGELEMATGDWDEAVRTLEAGSRAVPELGPWAAPRIAECRRILALVAGGGWAAELVYGGQALRRSDPAAARTRYERALALLEEELRPLSEAERTERLAAPRVKAGLLDAHYNLACALGRMVAGQGRSGEAQDSVSQGSLRDAAFEHLESALRLGWTEMKHLGADPDLASLHDDPRWAAVAGGAK